MIKIIIIVGDPNSINSELIFKSWKNPPDDFSLDLFCYYEAKKQKLKIHRFPVKFDKRLYGHSKWNFGFSSKLKFIKRTIIYSFNLKNKL